MAYNDRKIVKILMEQCQTLDERFPGYRKDMKDLLVEVLNLERTHAISRMNITQKIGDRVNTLGMDLYKAERGD